MAKDRSFIGPHGSLNLLLTGIVAVVVAGYGQELSPLPQPNALALFRAMNYIIVTPGGPEDGGDFGPKTPNTKTGGIQEALDYARDCHAPYWPSVWSAKNVFIAKGIYGTSETIKIPWMGENFHLEAGDSFIGYGGETGDAVVIDSQMNCRLSFGYVVAGNLKDGAVVRLKPQTPFDQAPKGVLTLCVIDFMAIVGSGSVVSMTEKAPGGVGLLLDASSGPILWTKIYSPEINACQLGVHFNQPKGGGGILYNRLDIPFIHLCSTGLKISDGVRNNQFNLGIEAPVKALIAGQENRLTLDFLDGRTEQNIVFEETAADNMVYVAKMPKGIVNNAVTPTNLVFATNPGGFAVETPGFPASGQPLVNRNPYPVQILITDPGQVTQWQMINTSGKTATFAAGLTVGQQLSCQPGEGLKFDYATAPAWIWKAVR